MKTQEADGGYEVDFGRLPAEEWADVLTEFDDAVIYQTWQYGAERWGGASLSHVVVRRDDRPVAAAQVAEAGAPRLGVGVCYVPWGPLFRPRGRAPQLDALRRIAAAMRSRYCERMGLCLRMRPQPVYEEDFPLARVLTDEGLRRLESVPPHRTILMDLALPLEEIRRRTKRTYRQHLKKAVGSGIEVRTGTDAELLRGFMGLYDEMRTRKCFDGLVDPRDFARIQEGLPDHLRMTTTMCSRRGKPVSALVTSAIGDTAIGLFAASSPEGRETCAAYLMWWHAVEQFKGEGRRRLDLGGIDPETTPGPARFKARLAGKTGSEVRHPGLFEAQGGLASRICVGAGWRLRKAGRRLALAARSCIRAAGRAGKAFAGKERQDAR